MSTAIGARPEVTLVVSVDTEEDNWNPTRSGITARNILELPRLDALFRRLGGVRATYFTTYAVVDDARARAVLRGIDDGGHAEIGTHLHPWNTPPTREPLLPRNTMLKNLAYDLQLAKLQRLTRALEEAFAVRPQSFRAGRYGLGCDTVRALIQCGYTIDSSVTPFVSWVEFDDGPDFVGAPLQPYWLSALGGDVRSPAPAGQLLELPLSCGFSRSPFALWGHVWRSLDTPAARRLHLGGAAARAGLIRRVFLSPELATVRDMLACSRRLVEEGLRYLHVTWHSPSLVPGLSPFVATTADLARFYESIERFIEGLADFVTVRFATVSEAAARADEVLSPAASTGVLA